MSKQLLYLILFGLVFSCTQHSQIADLEIPSSLPKFEIFINNGEAFDGYIFLRKIVSPGVQFMINSEGQIVWYQISDTTILRVYTPYDRSYLALYSNKEIHEITYDGDTLLKLSYGDGGFDRILHHEILKDSNDDILALTKEIILIDLSELGGKQSDTIKTDGIIKLSRTGQKLWSWSLEHVMDPLTYPEINRYKNDWGHANAFAIDDDGHYLISWRDFDQIWKINSESGEIIWKYGAETINRTQDKFYQPHSIHRNLDGDYMVFDNGIANIRRSSRAVMFNRFEDSIRNTLTIDLPDSMFTVKQGSVYQFAEDRFLFSSTMRNSLIITNRKGDILWLAKSDHEFYRAYYLDKAILN